MSFGLNMRLGIGGYSLNSILDSVPFKSDLVSLYNSRDELTLVNSISANNAAIVGGWVGKFNGDNHLSLGAITGGAATYLRINVMPNASIGAFDSAFGSGINSDNRLAIYYNAGAIEVGSIVGGVSLTKSAAISLGETMLVELEKEGSDCRVTMDGVDLGLIGNDLFSILNSSTANFIGCLTVNGSSAVTSLRWNGQISDFHISGIFDVHLNNHAINSLDNTSLTWDGLADYQLTKSYTPMSTLEALNLGYCQLSTGEQVINYQFELPVDAVAYPSDKLHNGIASFISLNPTGSLDAVYDLFDRSNQTTASTDSDYYDDTDRITRSTYYAGNDFNELEYDRIQSYLQTADMGKLFLGYQTNYQDKLNVFELLVYATAKSGADLTKVLNHINY